MKSVRDSELRKLSPDERRKVYAQLAEAAFATPNGEIEELNAELRSYEQRYELSSAHLVQALESGHLRETADVASWVITLRLRDHVVAQQTQP
jgi:hypothetical protein